MAAPFEFSEIQANHILDMQLGRLTRSAAPSSRGDGRAAAPSPSCEAILADRGRAARR
jgi:DNA gyrase/topoisomerase IV subunit A